MRRCRHIEQIVGVLNPRSRCGVICNGRKGVAGAVVLCGNVAQLQLAVASNPKTDLQLVQRVAELRQDGIAYFPKPQAVRSTVLFDITNRRGIIAFRGVYIPATGDYPIFKALGVGRIGGDGDRPVAVAVLRECRQGQQEAEHQEQRGGAFCFVFQVVVVHDVFGFNQGNHGRLCCCW